MLKFTASQKERLDKFLAGRVPVSRGRIQKAIKDGFVLVDGEKIFETDFQIKEGQTIDIPDMEETEALKPSSIELKVVFENDDLAVIDKPAGLVVHPGAGNTEDTLAQALLSVFPGIEKVGEPHRPGIVHRLDEDTSGLMIVAKNQKAYDYLKQMFLDKEIEKRYLALVHGKLGNLSGRINVPIAKASTHRKMRAGEGKEAITDYKVLAENDALDQYTLIELKLHTGRTHQIRVHMSHTGHPIVGDSLYGGAFKASDRGFAPRQFLHAYKLKFKLMDGTWIELVSNLPEDLKKVLKKVEIKYDEIV